MDNLGARMRDVRLGTGLTVREFAKKVGRSASFISQIESGRSQPSVATLYAFARMLGVSVDELFELTTPSDSLTMAPPPAARVSVKKLKDNPHEPRAAWPPTASTNSVSVLHPNHRAHLDMAAGVVWERLAATPEPDITFAKISYAPGATSTDGEGPISHAGYEYGYVLTGEVEVTVGGDVFVLRAGESIGFDSSLPHLLRNPGDIPFEGVWLNHAALE